MSSLATLLAQIGVILLAARVVGRLLRRIGQPQVVGEMVAGILLGPSLLGLLLPGVSAGLYPPESLRSLGAVSEVGIVLFMFLVGLEVDPLLLRSRGRAAVVTSQAGMVVPFALGGLLGLYLYPVLAPGGVHRIHFVAFMGSAMSMTAFPVLVRILAERDMMRSNVGIMAIACAAVNDVAGWAIFGVVVLLTRSVELRASMAFTVLGLVAFAAVLFLLVRPLLRRMIGLYLQRGFLSNDLMALVLLLVFTSALASELLGVHALFGAFVLGVVVPRRSEFSRALVTKMEDLVVVLFLPVFFALSGLRTRIGLLAGTEMWAYCALVLLVAIAGKFGGSSLAARMSGLSWREAGALGVLMNTRGLVELVILNLGLELGIISPPLFTMMVIMALLTTIATTPLLQRIYPARRWEQEAAPRLLEKAV